MQLIAKVKINKILSQGILMRYTIQDYFQARHSPQTCSIKMEVNHISSTIFNKSQKLVIKYKKKYYLQTWKKWIY